MFTRFLQAAWCAAVRPRTSVTIKRPLSPWYNRMKFSKSPDSAACWIEIYFNGKMKREIKQKREMSGIRLKIFWLAQGWVLLRSIDGISRNCKLAKNRNIQWKRHSNAIIHSQKWNEKYAMRWQNMTLSKYVSAHNFAHCCALRILLQRI